MTDFLLELRSEEIPARMQEKASADLAKLFEGEIAKAGLAAAAIEVFATPRRLALIARDLPAATQAVREETKGPKASAPPQALEGFLRKTGLRREQLEERDGTLFAIIEKPGRATAEVLAEAIPAIVRAFPWPKSMRWGKASATTSSLRWVRPLQGIVALFGEEVVPFAIEGIESGAVTVGHRFHHPGPITIGSAADYAAKLRACHVILDPAERKQIIRDGASAQAASLGLIVLPDEGLVAENAGLTEFPVPLIGEFDPEFLSVPPEVIQLTMRTNQKYFALSGVNGRINKDLGEPKGQESWSLAPAFLCTANIEAADGGEAIVAGNRKVLAARLSDARFFWEQDLKVPLAQQAAKLGDIVFHEKLGTVADKVERVAKLARWLVEEGIIKPLPAGPHESNTFVGTHEGGVGVGDSARVSSSDGVTHPPAPSLGREGEALADMAEQAARLCKADLVTGMVGEFPELQGVMGGYYARAEGLPDAVADAIRDHYKPVGQGDEVPTAPVTVAVSLADKLDTLACFFAIDEKPTGSKDPFALRRAAIGIVGLVEKSRIRLPLKKPYRGSFLPARTYLRLDNSQVSDARASIEQDYFKAPELFARRLGQAVRSTFEFMEERAHRPHDPDMLDQVAREREEEVLSEYRASEAEFIAFFADRLKVQQREAGVRHDLIDAVFALGGEDDLVRLLARVKALQAFVGTEEGANLLAGYKRAANILRKESFTEAPDWTDYNEHDPGITMLELIAALDAVEPRVAEAVAAEDFECAMSELARLRGPIDAFFDQVIVNDPDPAKRAARLRLLARIRAACHTVADFSKIEG